MTSIYTGQYVYDYYKNPYSYIWFNILFNDEEKDVVPGLKKLTDSLKDIIVQDNLKYILLESGDEEYILLYHKEKYHFSKVVKNTDDFFLLCDAKSRGLCDCKSYLMLYIPNEGVFKSVERAFSFSILNNLKYQLQKYSLEEYINAEDELCEFLTALQ